MRKKPRLWFRFDLEGIELTTDIPIPRLIFATHRRKYKLGWCDIIRGIIGD